MNLFDFYSRKFSTGDLVAAYRTSDELIGYGVLLKIAASPKNPSQQLSDWSDHLGNKIWEMLINDKIIQINENDQEKL